MFESGDSRIECVLIQASCWKAEASTNAASLLSGSARACSRLVVSGEPCRAVAEQFDISVASVVKWSQRARATGSAAAKPMGGKRPYLLEGEREWLLARLAENPDITLHRLLAELGERGVVVSCDTLWRFLKRQAISLKKTVFVTEQDRPDIAPRRAWWKRHQLKIDPARPVFIDETWAKTNMARTLG